MRRLNKLLSAGIVVLAPTTAVQADLKIRASMPVTGCRLGPPFNKICERNASWGSQPSGAHVEGGVGVSVGGFGPKCINVAEPATLSAVR